MNTTNEWCRDIVRGIFNYIQECEAWDIWIEIESSSMPKEVPPGWKGDGIIARVNNEALEKELLATNLPIVNIDDSPLDSFSGPSIFTDDRKGTRMAIDFFINRGLTNLALFGTTRTPLGKRYTQAYQEAVWAVGLSIQTIEGRTSDEAIKKELFNAPKPIGILCFGAVGAKRIVGLCNELKLNVPHDVAILSSAYDEILCHSCYPPISGLIPPTERIGFQAAAQLHRLMNGEKTEQKTYIPPLGFVERLSTNTMAVLDPHLISAMKFIQEHACGHISISDILRIIPMSRRTFERRFSEAYHRTPAEEIRRIRINHARTLLTTTKDPVYLISDACGYAAYNYFSHAFKQATGLTPSAYRKHNC